jgi:hypothetical protein
LQLAVKSRSQLQPKVEPCCAKAGIQMTLPTRRKICVIGGSNSIKAEGWATQLAERVIAGNEFLNESVGGVPCIMGYYRLVALKQLKPGDIVLWEYALNDQNHIDNRGYDPKLLLRFCEHTIRLCQKRGLRFIPLIFASQATISLPEMTPYRRDLRALFDHYGLDYFDVTEELPKKMNRTDVPKFVYFDESHYKVDAFVVRYIATQALMLIRAGAGVVGTPERMFGAEVDSIRTVTTFDTGHSELFKNSRVSVNRWTPSDSGEPVSITVQQGPFRLVGVVMLCTSFGGAFRVQAAGREFAISATYLEDKFTKPLLKFFTLSDDLDAGVTYPAGSTIAFHWEDGSLPLANDYGFMPKLNPEQLMGRQSSVVGLMLEQLTG